MVACLEKTEGNSKFHIIADFLTSSTIHHALTDSLEDTIGSEGDQVQSPHDSPFLSGHTSDKPEGALNLKELFSICTNLSNRVLALETVKDAQAAEIIALKAGIKKLEMKLNERRLSEETEELVSIARLEDSTVWPDKAKEKGVSIKDVKDSSRPARSILTLNPLLTIDSKDKSKGVLQEPKPAKKMNRSDLDVAQIAKDVKVARLLYEEELAELERENKKRQREEEASKATIDEMYNEVQARIKADALFNMGGYKYSQLKVKTFVEIQGLYERQKRVIDNFMPMDLDDAVDKEKVVEEPDSTKVEIVPNEEGEVDYKFLTRDFQSLTRSQNSITLTDMKQSVSTIEYSDLMEVLDGSKLF
nr:hypothetical protein [Tanacetum cinerariifolium]